MMTTTVQAIGYVRRSTDKQDMSLEQQRQKLQQFAGSRGWTLSHVFDDDAISGSDMNRPGLERMMAFAKSSNDVQVVIAWERNRLARPKDPLDGLMLERQLLSAGKRVVYAATGQEADRSFSSGLIGYVEHFQSGDYLRKLSRDTMRGLVHRAEMGLWTGGPIPFGFDRLVIAADGTPKRVVRDLPDRSQVLLDAETGNVIERVSGGHRYSKQDFERCTLTPSETARVAAVRKMFADFAAGAPIRVVRDGLNRAGLRTARGRVFTTPTIHAMLDNVAYVGRCVYNRRTESKWHRHVDGRSIERHDDERLEHRPETDWIVKHDAWPAIIDADTFDRVQQRRRESKQKHVHVTGTAVRSPYRLTGLAFCGVCGGLLTGQTTTSGKGYRTRYYVCATHHRGDHAACPRRYKVPATAVEDYIFGVIRDDLAKLRDDDQLRRYVRDELERIAGSRCGQSDRLQRRMADLDQQLAKLRDHLKALDPATAASLGLYDDAKAFATERAEIERDLAKEMNALPDLPDANAIRARAAAAFDELQTVLEGGTIEQQRELLALYVQRIKADPDAGSVQIGLYPALFSRKVAGGGFEPPTSGL
jgi:DNA invertase Pin-like site-specific DNA recombinase